MSADMDFVNVSDGNVTVDSQQCLTLVQYTVASGLSIPITILTLASNCLFTGIINRRNSKMAIEPFLLSLAIGDIIFSITTLPVVIAYSFTKSNAIDWVSIHCFICGFCLFILHMCKILSYFALSLDCYMLVSSRTYRRVFPTECKSSLAVLLWFVAIAVQILILSVSAGYFRYSCDVGICILAISTFHTFVIISIIVTAIVSFILILMVITICIGRHKLRKVTPLELFFTRIVHPERELNSKPNTNVNVIEDDIDVIDLIDEILTNEEDCKTRKLTLTKSSFSESKIDDISVANIELNDMERKEVSKPVEYEIELDTELGRNAVKIIANTTLCEGTISNKDETVSDQQLNVQDNKTAVDVIENEQNVDVVTITPTEKVINEDPLNTAKRVTVKRTKEQEDNYTLQLCLTHTYSSLVSFVAFLVCWIPFYSGSLLSLAVGVEQTTIVRFIFLWMGLFNGSMNVCIFVLLNDPIKRNFGILLRR